MVPRVAASLVALMLATAGWAQAPLPTADGAGSLTTAPLVYVGDREFKPYEYLDAQGRPSGFNIAVAQEVSRILGRPLVVRLAPWAEAYGRLASNDADMGTLGHSAERARRFRLVAKTWTLNQIVAFKHGRDAYPVSIDEMGSESIGVERASLVAELLAALPEGRRPMLVETTSQQSALRMLYEGRVTGVSGNELTLRFAASALAMPELVRVHITSVPYMLALSERAAPLEAEVRAAVGQLEASGQMDRLREQYLTVAPNVNWPWLRNVLATLGLLVIVVVSGVVLWNAQLRTKVERRTTQLQQSLGEIEESVRARDAAIAALGSSEARYRSLIGNMLGGLITVDAHGRIDLVNPAAERMFGYDPGELRGLPLSTLVPANSEEDARARLRAGFKRAIGRVTEWEGRRKDGTTFPFELALFAFDGPSGVHYAGNLMDISERRQLDRVKQEFTSVVSQEIRMPLTSLRASLRQLQEMNVGEQGRPILSGAISDAEQTIRFVNDMLDVARIEAGRLSVRPQACEVHDLVERALAAVAAQAATNRVVLRRDVRPALSKVVVDPERVIQMLVSLVSSAVKFAPADSDVTVGAEIAGAMLRLWVHDHGPGIPDEQMAHLFQNLAHLDGADARPVTPTGMGLAITKAIVEQHGGLVSVVSSPSEGTRFTIDLPAGAEAPIESAQDQTFATTGTGQVTPARRTS